MRALLMLPMVLLACTGEAENATGDADGDGLATGVDCDDADAAVGEASSWYADLDRDGHGDPMVTEAACTRPSGYSESADDCDDARAEVYPGAAEVCDGLDDDCDQLVDLADDNLDASSIPTAYVDQDGDGYGDAATAVSTCEIAEGYAEVDGDCDDLDLAVNPGAQEVCNGADDDCDGAVDDDDPSVAAANWYTDEDADGYGTTASATPACDAPPGTVATDGDCDDGNGSIHPGALEADCDDPTDYNCDGSSGYADADGDGAAACADCNDADKEVRPGTDERCDGIDNNCDGLTDGADAVDASTWYADTDGDGYGDVASSILACGSPSDYVSNSTDCDADDPAVNPAGVERCDGADNDCDGQVDDASAVDVSTFYADDDGDGYGDPALTRLACEAEGWCANDEDCDDGNPDISPDGLETCDGADNDCDGDVDESSAMDAITWYPDSDGDGYGDPASSTVSCAEPSDAVEDNTDCDDADGAVYPGADEHCDGVDENCNSSVDEGAVDPATWYVDLDGDGYGDSRVSAAGCSAPTGYVALSTDCDDTEGDIYPAATEFCDGEDNDCDSSIDEAGASGETTWFLDADSDGFGLATTSVTQCDAPAGYVEDSTDCSDAKPAVNPDATEACNGYDDDCDSSVDEAGSTGETAWYPDDDADGFGDDAGLAVTQCDAPADYVDDATDCDDGVAAVNPDAVEDCNGYDDDCDGATDDAGSTGETDWFEDADADGYGDESGVAVTQCDAPADYVDDASDCDDTNPDANPGEVEACNAFDDDCDGSRDESGCPGTVDVYGDHLYMYVTTTATWAAADTSCISYGYDLVTISGAAENTHVSSAAAALSSTVFWWAGLNDRTTEAAFVWSSAESSTYTHWNTATAEPNGGTSENCMELVRFYPANYWNDANCSTAQNYVCEAP